MMHPNQPSHQGLRRKALTILMAAAITTGASIAIAGGNELYVDDNWIGFMDGTVVDIDDIGGTATIGTDAFGAIQDAIDAAAINGDSIIVREGNYPGGIYINKGVTIRGDMESGVARGGGGPIFNTFIIGDWAVGGPSFGMHIVPGTENVNITGLHISGFYSGIFADPDQLIFRGGGSPVTTVSNIVIEDCGFDNNGLDALASDPRPGGINNPVGIMGATPQVAPGAISIADSNNFTVRNCVIDNNLEGDYPLSSGITVMGVANTTIITGNNVQNQILGVVIGAGHDNNLMGDTTNTVVADNYIASNATIGLYFIDGTTDNVFEFVQVSDNVILGNGEAGIVATVGGFTGGTDPSGSISNAIILSNIIGGNGFNDLLDTRGGVYMNLRAGATGGFLGVSVFSNLFINNENASGYPFAAAFFISDLDNTGLVFAPEAQFYGNILIGNERGYMGFSQSPPVTLDTNTFVLNQDAVVIRNASQVGLLTENIFFDNGAAVAVEAAPPIDLRVAGNIFSDQNVIRDTVVYDPNRTDVEGNWYANVHGFDRDADDGMGGNGIIDSINPAVNIIGNTAVLETAVVAQFNRDGDGLPDAIELFGELFQGGLGDFDNTYTFGGMFPDGFAGGGLNDDFNMDGYADWYETAFYQARMSEFIISPLVPAPLGDVTNNGSVDLGDAVRSLQILNGTLLPGDTLFDESDRNAINVTGTIPHNLNNALQILRWTNGSRTLFPAIVGVN